MSDIAEEDFDQQDYEDAENQLREALDKACQECGGSGLADYSTPYPDEYTDNPCPKCKGSGQMMKCPECKGEGEVMDGLTAHIHNDTCPKCKGSGEQSKEFHFWQEGEVKEG